MTAATYADLMAAADRAETHCGPGFARRIRERAEALRAAVVVRGEATRCPHSPDPDAEYCIQPCAFRCFGEAPAPAARAQLLERARQDIDRIGRDAG